jgi:hypothetical protein
MSGKEIIRRSRITTGSSKIVKRLTRPSTQS